MNTNHDEPTVRDALAGFAEAIGTSRIAGGCDDCDAYQTVGQAAPHVYMLTVHHDNTCPWLAQREGANRS